MVRERQELSRRSPGEKTSPVQRIGDYLVTSVLGQGGMGTVFRARHIQGGEDVAVKVMAPHLLRKENAARRFEAEADALRRIDHPNVVRMLDVGRTDDGMVFHVTELLSGELLTSLLARRGLPMPAEATLPFVLQICAGLQAAHDRDVVHRDLKPDNIFVAGQDPLQLKLFDFGVARLLDTDEGLTASGVMVGTPMFVAPEQAMGLRRNISPRTDIYSLGVLIYLMLCGEPPFDSDAFGVLLVSHAHRPPPPLAERAPQVPDTVARVVHWCLEKEPDRRPISARVLANAFAGAVTVSTRTPSVARSSSRSSDTAATRLERPRRAATPGEPGRAEDLETRVYDPEPEDDDTEVDALKTAYYSGSGQAAPERVSSPAAFAPTVRRELQNTPSAPGARRIRTPSVEDPPPTSLVQVPPQTRRRRHQAWLVLAGATLVLLSVAALTALTIALIDW
jgi:serine/threonine-protein kinase